MSMVSIIIPVYNQAQKLKNCLESLREQKFKDFEIIIIDDGSTDDPEKVANNFSKLRLDIKINFYKQENKGAPAARNRGWHESKGEYLFFCDADAILNPDCLHVLINTLLRHPESSYAYSSFLWGNKLFKVGEFSEDRLKSGPFIHTMSLIRQNDFPEKGWDESIKKFQDWDLYLTMLENKKRGIWLNKVLFKIQPGGTISSWLPSFAYKLMPFLPQVRKYNRARKIIEIKHKL